MPAQVYVFAPPAVNVTGDPAHVGEGAAPAVTVGDWFTLIEILVTAEHTPTVAITE